MSVNQVVSKQRIADHGEVYTHPREVNAMLDLVKQETERIDSTFLEPACGTGNFLVEILSRKLAVVKTRYAKSQLEYERHAVIAIASIYGIDILADNVAACQQRLFDIFNQQYTALYKAHSKAAYLNTARFILARNILHGDALTLKTIGDEQTLPKPIVFSQWKAVSGSLIKRHDYQFSGLFEDKQPDKNNDLFIKPKKSLMSDIGNKAFIPEHIQEFPPTNYLRLADATS
jgi:hypothetical protein